MSTTNDFLDKYLAVTTEPTPPTAEETAEKNKAVYAKISEIKKQIEELTTELGKQLKLLEEPKPDFDIEKVREHCKNGNVTNDTWDMLPRNYGSVTSPCGLRTSQILGGLCVEEENLTGLTFCIQRTHCSPTDFIWQMMQVAVKKQKKKMFPWLVQKLTSPAPCGVQDITKLFEIQNSTCTDVPNDASWFYVPIMKDFKDHRQMIIKEMVSKCYLQSVPSVYADFDLSTFYEISGEAAKQHNKDALEWATAMIQDREKTSGK